MCPAPATTDASIQELRSRFRGRILEASDAGYEAARHVWNGNIDRCPLIIAQCAGVADVIEGVKFARASGLLVAVRGGGHNPAGHATCDAGIVIDLTRMKGVRVDPVRRTARAEGGVTWAELDRETQAFGLATTGGSVSNTGVAGLSLGGGIGWLMGQHGFSCDNLMSADVVTADGRLLTVDSHEHPDLLWALQGGGGNFGVVTSFEFRLHAVGPMVLGGMVLHPLARAKEVLQFYRDFVRGLPDEAEAWAVLLTSPDGVPVVAVVLAYNGPIEDGERVLAPARTFGPPVLDLVQPMPYVVRQTLFDAAFASHGMQRYWKSGLAETFSDELIDIAIDGASNFSSPMSALIFIYIHGAAARVPSDRTAASALRKSQWDISAVAQWSDAGECDRHIGWTRQLWSRIEPVTGGSAYVNHIAGDDNTGRVRKSYGANYDKLVALKRKYDPTNLFRLNANIRPDGQGE